MSRYFEIIITGRQLAALVAGVVVLVAVAFGLGVAVRVTQPPPPAAREVIVAAPAPPVAPAQPTTPPSAPGASATTQAAPPPTAAATPALPPTAVPATKTPAASPVPKTVPRWVQVAAFGKRQQADGVRTRVIALGFTPKQAVVQPAAGGKFRIRLGPFPDAESAGRVAARLRAEGFGGAFVVKPGE